MVVPREILKENVTEWQKTSEGLIILFYKSVIYRKNLHATDAGRIILKS